jgi:hypothetical protein
MDTKTQVTRPEDAVSKTESNAMATTTTGKYYIAAMVIAGVVTTGVTV